MAFRRLPALMVALLFVDFIDEFASGMPTVNVPGIQDDFQLTYSTAAFIVFTVPLFVGWLLEPPLFLLSDRYPRKYFVVGGLVGMAVCDVAIGFSQGFWLLATALAFSAVTSGCGVSLSQATLMDAYPEERERVLARWTFMGATGDFAAPALVGAYALVSLGWRAAFISSGLFIAAYSVVVARQRFPEHPTAVPGDEDGEETGIRAALGMALRDRTLLVWLFGCWLCSLLDEILVAFGALFMRDELGAGPAERSAILMAFMAGGMVGLLLLERLLARVDPLRMLRAAALGSAIAYAAWLSVRSPVASAFWMFLTGLFSSSLYPIAKAQAYRALPGRSGMLNAVAHLFTPLDFLLPLALGLIADRFGLVAALTVLIAQPVGLFVIAARRSS